MCSVASAKGGSSPHFQLSSHPLLSLLLYCIFTFLAIGAAFSFLPSLCLSLVVFLPSSLFVCNFIHLCNNSGHNFPHSPPTLLFPLSLHPIFMCFLVCLIVLFCELVDLTRAVSVGIAVELSAGTCVTQQAVHH